MLGCLHLAAGSISAQVPAHTNLNSAAPASNRYLLIVETSDSMKNRGDGTLNALQDLLKSGMRGQLHQGDTLGLWTFSTGLKAGMFPLQDWSPQTASAVITRVLHYLQDQRCEDEARLDPVMLLANRLVQHSEFITIILVTTGEQKIHGTAFDDAINETFKAWHKKQSAAHMPFVTVLSAEKGRYVDYRVSQAPWTVELPPLPQDLVAERTAAAHAIVQQRPVITPRPAVVPPLIISGRKPQTAEPSEAAQAKPAAVTIETPVTVVSSAAVIESKPAVQPSAPSSVSGTALVESAKTSAEPGPIPTDLKPAAAAETVESRTSSSEPTAQPAEAALQSPPDSSGVVASSTSGGSSPAFAAAEVVPAKSFLWVNFVWLSALAGAIVTFGLMLLLRGRSRPVEHASLITRSFDQHVP